MDNRNRTGFRRGAPMDAGNLDNHAERARQLSTGKRPLALRVDYSPGRFLAMRRAANQPIPWKARTGPKK
jgi:hypothetical protein